jgi:hypothetical protein
MRDAAAAKLGFDGQMRRSPGKSPRIRRQVIRRGRSLRSHNGRRERGSAEPFQQRRGTGAADRADLSDEELEMRMGSGTATGLKTDS